MLRQNRFRRIFTLPVGYILMVVLLVVVLFFVFFRFSGNGSVAVLADLRERGTIVVGVLDDMPPYNQTDEYGNSVGFESDLATMIGETILGGPGVQFFFVNSKTARAYLDNGDCDMLIAMVTVNNDSQNDYNLTDPYVQEDVLLLSKAGVIPDLRVSDTVIGVIRGSDSQTVLNAYLESSDCHATVVEVASYPDAVEAINSGRINAFCAAYSALSRYNGNGLSINPIPVGHLNYAIAVRESDMDLFNAVKDALFAIQNDGRLNDLYLRYNLSAPVN